MPYGTGKYTYELVEGWAKLPQDWSFKDVSGLAVDKQDRIYVLNRGAHPVMVFDCEGNLLTTWGEELFENAHGAGIGPDGSIYCTDDHLHVIYKFTPEGELLQAIGNKGQPSDTGYIPEWHDIFWSLTTITHGGPPFNRPTGVSFAPSGNMYVADGYGNTRVHKFSPEGELLLSWGEPGYLPGQFRLPHFICVDKQERVWIADRENSRLQIFDSEGKFLDQWEDFIRPTDVQIDKNDIVYVTELCQRVSILSIDGQVLARFGNQGGKDLDKALFLAPHTVAIDSHGDIYVGEVSWSWTKKTLDRGPRVVQKFALKK
jgi:DNA-binding beta-propeller fold protein YncE